MNIIFTNCGGVLEEYYPQPASKFIPDWYKNTDSYFTGSKKPNLDGSNPGTIKRCIPVFDAITAGYIIVSPADIYITQTDGGPSYQWSSYNLIEYHPKIQAPEHPNRNGLEHFPKWINQWSIKTPKGYSTLFVQPFHRESVFTILPGVVDTDTYTYPVNFPFVLNDPKFEGLIPAGTPIAQVIPFKRDSWTMEIGGQKELNEILRDSVKLSTKFFDKYKTMFRADKEYK